jgi:hypothetical protein
VSPRRAALAALLALAVLPGCGGDDSSGPDPATVAAGLTAEGWTLFEAGSIGPAEDKFREALGALGSFAEAHDGLGWSLAYQDDLTGANTAFQSAIANGLASAEPRAGWAFVLAEKSPSDLAGAIARAGEALALEQRFVFAHDTTVSWWDLRLLRAQAYVTVGSLPEAAAEVESLGGNVPPPGPYFADSLLLEIERLGG